MISPSRTIPLQAHPGCAPPRRTRRKTAPRRRRLSRACARRWPCAGRPARSLRKGRTCSTSCASTGKPWPDVRSAARRKAFVQPCLRFSARVRDTLSILVDLLPAKSAQARFPKNFSLRRHQALLRACDVPDRAGQGSCRCHCRYTSGRSCRCRFRRSRRGPTGSRCSARPGRCGCRARG